MTPWISVEPNTNARAILGQLPFVQGRATFRIPPSRTLSVTLFANDLPSATNQGEVEIHGYRPAYA